MECHCREAWGEQNRKFEVNGLPNIAKGDLAWREEESGKRRAKAIVIEGLPHEDSAEGGNRNRQ